MSDNDNKYYLIRKRAVPEVLLKVIEAKRLLDKDSTMTVQKATELVGIGRSSFYKYKDDISPFHENAKGSTITFVLQMEDQPGILSNLLKLIAAYAANILTIHQTIPINGIASLTMSVAIPSSGDISNLIEDLGNSNGVHYVKVLAKE